MNEHMWEIKTGGTDIFVFERPRGGYTVQQGASHILLTDGEAAELATLLAAIGQGVGRLVRYSAG